MKKTICIFIALMLTFALAACDSKAAIQNAVSDALGGGNTPSAGNTETPSAPAPAAPAAAPVETPPPAGDQPSGDVPDGQAPAPLIRWMMNGAFSYEYTMTLEGPDGTYSGVGSMAIDGDNIAVSQEMVVNGISIKSRVIQKDGKMYVIDDENKFIMEMDAEMDLTEGMMTDYRGIVKTGEGTGEINGRTLPYEEYAEGEIGATVKYYLDGGDVYGFESEFEGYKVVMIITSASSRAPAGAFDLPEGYFDMSSFGEGFDLDAFMP